MASSSKEESKSIKQENNMSRHKQKKGANKRIDEQTHLQSRSRFVRRTGSDDAFCVWRTSRSGSADANDVGSGGEGGENGEARGFLSRNRRRAQVAEKPLERRAVARRGARCDAHRSAIAERRRGASFAVAQARRVQHGAFCRGDAVKLA